MMTARRFLKVWGIYWPTTRFNIPEYLNHKLHRCENPQISHGQIFGLFGPEEGTTIHRNVGNCLELVSNVMAQAQKPDLVFQRNVRVHLNWWGEGGSVQSTTGSRGVRISSSNGSNAGYTMFWGSVQDYWLPTPLACFPFTSPTVRHSVPSHFNWAVPVDTAWCHSNKWSLIKELNDETARQ